ncbi:MAG: flagellin [Bacillota bacterium]|nr:flagellin [Bacillota bacterium]
MIINHNLMANNAIRNMNINSGNASKSMEKLSSGLAINSASDNAAGLAISEKMRGQIRGLDQASSNAQDGISLIQTAEGALNETQSILQRMRELGVQSASDTNTASDRQSVQKEVDQLANEITRIGDTTQFNTQKLLDGNFSGSFQIGANQNQSMSLKIGDMRSNALGVTGDVTVKFTNGGTVTAGASTTTDIAAGTYDVSAVTSGGATTYNLVDTTGTTVAKSTDGLTFKNTVDNTNTIVFTDMVTSGKVNVTSATQATADNVFAGANGGLQAGTYTFDSVKNTLVDQAGNVIANTADGKTFTSGANTVLTLTTALTATDNTVVVHGVDVSNQASANKAITTIQKALDNVSAQRASLGAYQNRLEHTINNLGTSSENLTASESRIRDVDMAKEMSTFSKNNILSQAAQAMLAQANQQPQQVLQLLR